MVESTSDHVLNIMFTTLFCAAAIAVCCGTFYSLFVDKEWPRD